MVGEALAEDVVEDLVKQGDRGPGMDVEQALVDLGQPMLLVVAQRVERTQQAGLLGAEIEVLLGEAHALFEADGAPAGLG